MGSCVNSNLTGKEKAVLDSLIDVVGESKAYAMFNKKGITSKLRSEIMSSYPEIELRYVKEISYKDKDVFNQIELSEMTVIADNFNKEISELNIFRLKEKSVISSIEKGKEPNLKTVEDVENSKFKNNNYKFYLGYPLGILKGVGIPSTDKVILDQKNFEDHILSTKHNLKIKNFKELVRRINNPIAVFTTHSFDRDNNYVVHTDRFNIITELTNNDGQNIKVIFSVKREGDLLNLKFSEVFNGISLKNENNIIQDILENKALFINKKKMSKLLTHSDMHHIGGLSDIKSKRHLSETNIKQFIDKINKFENKSVDEILFQRQQGKIIGQANIKAKTVLIDAINQKTDTLPHEYAHHYIAWFRNNPIVQEGIDMYGNEEALVQAIGEQAVKQEGKAYNWWKSFLNWLLDKNNETVKNLLTNSFLNKTDLNIYNGIDKNEFFKTTVFNKQSLLFKDLTQEDLDVISYFETAYSDRFTKIYPWNKMQQLETKTELKEFIEEKKLDINDYYSKTLEPRIEVIESFKDVDDIARDKFSKNLGFTKNTKTNKKITDNIVKKYITLFKKKFGVEINVISKKELPADAKGIKGFYSTSKGKIFLVEEEVTGDTIFHEMFHPILDVIKRKHSIVYHDLVSDLDNLKDEKWYKEVIAKYPELTPSELIDELIVTAVGLHSEKLIKGTLGKTNAWKKFVDLVSEFLTSLNKELKNTFGVKGNIIDLSKTNTTFTIDNISKVLIDESMVFKGIEQDIKENVLFYDNEGNPLNIDPNLDLDEFLISFSKDLEDNAKNFSNPVIIDHKTLINKMIKESNSYKSKMTIEGSYKVNKDYLSPTALLKELLPASEDKSLDIAIRSYLIQTKEDYEKLKQNPEMLNKEIAFLKKEFDRGNAPAIEQILKQREVELNFFGEVGNNGHAILETFFNEVDKIKRIKNDITDVELDDIKKKILQTEISENPSSQEKYSNLLNGMISFVTQIETENKDKGMRYLPEFVLSSSKIEKEGKIDLLLVNNEGKFSIFDFKFKKTEADGSKSFDKGWNMGFEKYKGTRVWNTGKNKASLQVSLYSLGLGLEYTELKEDKTGVIYIETKVQKDEDGNLDVADFNVKRADNGNYYLPLTDYKGVILDNVDPKKRKELYKDNDAVEGAINNTDDYMSHLLGEKEVDTKNFEKLAKTFYNDKSKWIENPDVAGEMGFIDVNANKVMVGFALKPKFIRLDNLSEEKALETLEQYYKVKDAVNEKVIDNTISYHQTGNFNFNKGIKNKEKAYIEKMLKGLDSDWELKKITNIPGMESQIEPIVLAINSKTGMSRILYFSKDKSENISFRKGSKVRKTIVGNISDEKYVKTKFKNKDLRNATKENMRLLKSTLVAAKLKHLMPNFNIDRIIISEGVGSGIDPTPHSITDGLSILRVTNEVMSEQIEFEGEIKKVFSNPEVFNSNNYRPSYIDSLLYTFNESLIVPKSIKEKVFDVMENYRSGIASKIEVLNVFKEIRLGLIEAINASNEYDKFEQSREYLAFSHAILDLSGIEGKTLNSGQNWISDQFTLERNSPEYIRRALMSEINKNEVQLRREINRFELELNKKLTALAKSKGININEAKATGSLNRLYTNLYENIDNYDVPETLMTLKDPDDTSNNLNETERDFIRFFNEHIYNSTKYLAPNIFNKVENEDDEKVLTKGWVPVYSPRDQSKNAFGASLKEQEVRDVSEKDKNYISRLEMPDSLGSKFSSHQYLAGVDKQTKEIRSDFSLKNNVELNLEAVLKSAVVESVEAKVHDKTLLVYEALRSVVEGEYFLFGDEKSYRDIITRLDEVRDQFIFNESAMKTKSQRVLAGINKTATGLLIVSGKQAIMDSMTFGFSSSSYVVANVINRLFDKNVVNDIGFFGFKSWVKAGTMMLSNHKLVRQIQAEYGLDETNAMYLKSANKLKTMRSDWMEIGFYPTRTTMKVVHMQMMLASMIEDGSFNAYSLDENGLLQYDEKKDPRFYNEKGELINEEFLLAVKNQALKEGYSLEDNDPDNPKSLMERKLLYGYTFKERETIRSKSVDMIGVIGKEGEAKFSQIAALRYFMKFKAWIIAKANLYFRENQVSEVYSEWKKTLNPDGTISYELIPSETEGIFQSFVSILNKLKVYKLKIIKNGGLSSIEKKNLSILFSHLLHFGVLVGMSSALYLTCSEDEKDDGCWVDKTTIGKTSKSLLANVQGDIMTPMSMYQMIFGQNSLFAGIDSMIKMTRRIIALPFDIVYEDKKTSAEVMNEAIVKSWAAYRDAYSLVELFKEDEPLKGYGDDPFSITQPISNDMKEKLETGEGL